MNTALLVLFVPMALLGWAGFWRERRRRQAAEADIQRVIHEIEQKRHDYLRSFAHALRNPLSGIVLLADLMAEEEELAVVQGQALKVKRQAAAVVDLITLYLEMSALDAERYETMKLPFDLGSTLKESLALLSGCAAEKQQRLEVSSPSESLMALGDAEAARRVLEQVLSNAVKFSPKGGRISLSISAVQGQAQILVRDEGPGFTPEDRAYLFQRLTPLSARPTGGEAATGLGLAIAARLMALMGGRIEVLEGKGGVRLHWDLA